MKDEPQPPTKDDDLADAAGELILEANEQLEQNRQEQKEFLDAVAEEEGAEVLETQTEIHGHMVDVSATLNGDLMDAMSRIDERLERLENEEGRAYEFSETADEVCQLLADVTDEPTLSKAAFYQTYEDHGLDPIGVVLEEVFEALKAERERRQGVADGFRPN